VRWLAAVHLLALGIGLGAVGSRAGLARSAGCRRPAPGIRRRRLVGASAGLWILTGLLRAFAGYEKGASYYLHNHLFLTKMGLLLLILALELAPMLGLIRWRAAAAKGTLPDTSGAPRFARISTLQAVLIVLMVILATGMARGYGSPSQ
jgi:putative membrane protein